MICFICKKFIDIYHEEYEAFPVYKTYKFHSINDSSPTQNHSVENEFVHIKCRDQLYWKRTFNASNKYFIEEDKEMPERRFEVISGDNMNDIIASNMRLDDALLLIKAMYDKYYNETNMVLAIREELKPVVSEDE